MLKNYLLTAVRNLRKHPLYTSINVIGLALGLACGFVILLFILNELRYDDFHEKKDRIYRLTVSGTMNEQVMSFPLTNVPMGPSLKKDFPEVENFVRFSSGSGPLIVENTERNLRFYEDGFFYADSSFFSVFSFKLLQGDPASALAAPNTLVINEEMAQTYFGDENPVGKTLELNDSRNYTVTGVMENVPENSHFIPRYLASFETLLADRPYARDRWISFNYLTYVLLQESADAGALERKLPDFIDRYMGEESRQYGLHVDLHLQPLTEIYLYSDFDFEFSETFDISYIYLFSAVALFILLIACINFMNLSTARSANRAREVGLRKVFGAYRGHLIRQFIGESVLFSVLAFFVALVLMQLFIPVFNGISGKTLAIDYTGDWGILAALAAISVFAGLLAGSYPAFFLSSFRPVRVLQGDLKSGAKSSMMRSVLVVLQFSISIGLIIGTAVVYDQLNFIQHKRLGFDEENVIAVPIQSDDIRQDYQSVRERLVSLPGVVDASPVSQLPTYTLSTNAYIPEGYSAEQTWAVQYMTTDHHFTGVMNVEVVQGRPFSTDIASDTSSAMLINETAAQQLGWDDPIGREIRIPGEGAQSFNVVGVFRDYHFRSLREPIAPLFIHIDPNQFNSFLIRLEAGNVSRTLESLEEQWAEIDPGRPFKYTFLDEYIEQMYDSEKRLGGIFRAFALFAVAIACLGLFGLASFTAEQRTREIGIRKTLGATAANIVLLLSRDFVKLILIANIVAWPAAYFGMQHWLSNFAYKTDISIFIFIIAAIAALAIALLTVIYQSLKAAFTDPAQALRYE